MKPLFRIQYFLLAIALCIITSCKMTGNFAIVKRQHGNGYYIQTPSFVKNSDNRTTQIKNSAEQSETDQTATDEDNLIASINAMPLAETAQEAKAVTNDTYLPQYALKYVVRDSSKKKTSAPVNKNAPGKPANPITKKTQENPATNKPPEPAKDDRKLDWVSVTGFALCMFALALAPVDIAIAATSGVIAFWLAVFAGLCFLTGLGFSFTGYNRVSDVTKKLKGKGFALTGVILGTILFIAAFVAFIYAAYRVFFGK